jgi:hypothetical protein
LITVEKTRSSPFSAALKPILKRRSYFELMLEKKGNNVDFVSIAARTVVDERRRQLEDQQLREAKRRNPLTPTHFLLRHLKMQRKHLTSVSRDRPSSATVGKNVPPTLHADCFDRRDWTSTGAKLPTTKHIRFKRRVEQRIVINIYNEEDNASGSEEETLFMMRWMRAPSKLEHSTIAKLPSTKLRPAHKPKYQPSYPPVSVSSRLGSQKDQTGFCHEERAGFSTSAFSPEFPIPRYSIDQQNSFDEFSFDDCFASQYFPDTTPNDYFVMCIKQHHHKAKRRCPSQRKLRQGHLCGADSLY